MIIVLFSGLYGYAQAQPDKKAEKQDYSALLSGKDYKGALKIIQTRIEAINDTRVDEKRVPSDFITLGGGEAEGISKNKILNRQFRERKAQPFFIEDNKELYTLNKDAGKCCFETHSYEEALNYYYQSLRFHQPSAEEDADVFHDIA